MVEKSHSDLPKILEDVHEIMVTKVCGSPKKSVRHRIEEFYKSIKADTQRRIKRNIYHLKIYFDKGDGHTGI
jgi:hypothetical protein